MAVTHLVVQASGAMFKTIQPSGWTYCFGVYVCDNEGTPFTGLTKRHFAVWQLTSVMQHDLSLVLELNEESPSSSMPGIYRLQTKLFLPLEAPPPQQFVFAIRVSFSRRPLILHGFTTVPITYLGKPQLD